MNRCISIYFHHKLTCGIKIDIVLCVVLKIKRMSSGQINKLNKKSQAHMAQCILAIRERLEGSGMPHAEIVEMLGNPDAFAVTNTDFEKKRRARAAIPYYERCSGKKADSDQCTRRRQQGSLFCGTHVKGTPYGQISDGDPVSDKIQVHVEEVNGIVYWVDDDSNVYSQEDVYLGKKDPRVIAKITDALGDDGFTPIRSIMCTHEIV